MAPSARKTRPQVPAQQPLPAIGGSYPELPRGATGLGPPPPPSRPHGNRWPGPGFTANRILRLPSPTPWEDGRFRLGTLRSLSCQEQ